TSRSIETLPASIGVESVALLLRGFASGSLPAIVAVLVIAVTLPSKGSFTCTAKARLPPAPPPATAPIASVQAVPGPDPSGQLQPGELEAAKKLALDGTVSLSTTPVAPVLPALV